MTSSSVSQDQNPILTFEGKRYDLNKLPDDLKELVRGMQVADAQLRMHEDTLKVLAVGRQSMAMQLNACFTEIKRIENERLTQEDAMQTGMIQYTAIVHQSQNAEVQVQKLSEHVTQLNATMAE